MEPKFTKREYRRITNKLETCLNHLDRLASESAAGDDLIDWIAEGSDIFERYADLRDKAASGVE